MAAAMPDAGESEKPQRKQALKFAKDVFAGTCGAYPDLAGLAPAVVNAMIARTRARARDVLAETRSRGRHVVAPEPIRWW